VSTPRSAQLPPGVRAGTVVLPTGQLAVLTCTAADAVDTVVLVPGYTGGKEDFLAILELIASYGHTVLAYDQRGQHESPGDDDPGSYTIEALAGDLLDLLHQLGPAHVVGHSFGGLVARAAAIREPAAMRSLTLLCSGPGALPGARADGVRALRPVLVEGGKEALWQALAEAPAGDPLPQDVAALMKARFDGNSASGLIAMGDELLSARDRTAQLAATGLPVLVACGAKDDAWPPATQADMARRLGARHAVIADAVHSPGVEQPGATVAVLEQFWSSLDSADRPS
jgi:pimeloyl-ACP methyl ester carboxylesterase